MSEATTAGGRKRQGKCPICGKLADAKLQPFCSARCADIDLGRWLGETYRVAGEDGRLSTEEDDED